MSNEVQPLTIEIIRPNKIYAEINPKVLRWARETRGWSIEEAAKKTGYAVNTIKSVEEGNKKLTMKQLINIASKYKRSISVFYFDKIPEDPKIPDFRGISYPNEITGNLFVQIREIITYRKFAIQINKNRNISYNYNFIGKFSSSSGNFEIIEWIRKNIPLTWKELGKKKDNDVLKIWIERVENLGILVFQFINIDTSITRGFSISEKWYPIIALNRKDSYYARIFTLIHEVTHLLIANSGICISSNSSTIKGIERKCDEIAAEILLPFNDLKDEISHIKDVIDQKLFQKLPELSDKFKVSYSTILVSLNKNHILLNNTFHQMMNQLPEPQIREYRGGPPFYQVWKSRTSPTFLKIVFEAIENHVIDRSEAMLTFNLTSNSFGDLESSMRG